MRIKLDYGRKGLAADLPDENIAAVLQPHYSAPLPDPLGAVARALEAPIGSSPLRELAHGQRDAVIVISDFTRPVPNKVILPALLACLSEAGIPREKVFILVATGLHRSCTEAELEEMLGSEVLASCRIEQHVARDPSTLVDLGTTRRGTPVKICRRYLEADLKIATGLIEPHFMAGYSGGRKAICPGLCGPEVIRIEHGPTFLEDLCADSGIIEGNPCHEEALEVAHRAGVDFIVNVTQDDQRRITGIFAGDLEVAHEEGTASCHRQMGVEVDEPAPIVVTTSAGYPLDATYYQAVKGMVAALPVLEPGGTILLAAECSQGEGSAEFRRQLAETPDMETFMATIQRPDHFVIDQWEVEMLFKALRKGEVWVYAEGLSPESPAYRWTPPISSIGVGIEKALEKHGPKAKIIVIPSGAYVLPILRQPAMALY